MNDLYGDITEAIIEWGRQNDRQLPWKNDKNPYHILLSEIILQQTRIKQGLPYYYRFVEAYPTIKDLAKASEDEVLRMWQGLGYYARARNLLGIARKIVNELDSKMPASYQEWIALKGIGPYTAAAVASFAFDEPKAVVDGNVYRVLSRLLASSEDFYTTRGNKFYQSWADKLLAISDPGRYNQAIMDLGALICKPQAPECHQCPIQQYCAAYLQGETDLYPVKKKRIQKKQRIFHYFVCQDPEGALYIRKRRKKDIWQNLYEFALHEGNIITPLFEEEICRQVKKELGANTLTVTHIEGPNEQLLTHQKIISYFYLVQLDKVVQCGEQIRYEKVIPENLSKFAFPKSIDCYLEKNYINLNI